MAMQQLDIATGIHYEWETRLGFPSVTDLFVGENGALYSTPTLKELSAIDNARQIHYSIYDGGRYIVVTDTAVLYTGLKGGTPAKVADISATGEFVSITENLQNQVSIVDGAHLYVFDQSKGTFEVMSETQGFTLKKPISCCELNTYTIVLDGDSGQWQISNPNNALVYNPLDIEQIESAQTKGMAVTTLNNNLYILGTTAVERWEPSFETNPYSFPFQKDVNYRTDYGALTTGSVISDVNTIYFLSSKYTVMEITASGTRPLTPPGTTRQLSLTAKVDETVGSFYSYRGQEFYQLTAPDADLSWLYCVNTKTWSFSSDLVLGAANTQEVVLTSEGIYSLSNIHTHRMREWVSGVIKLPGGPTPYRHTLNAVKAQLIQGLIQTDEPGYCELTVSTDARAWGNSVNRELGLTGERQAIQQWNMNIAAHEFILRMRYYGALDLTIDAISTLIN